MRFFITFAYDGSKYKGYQKQPKERTIQGELERVLTIINNNTSVSVSASGRTDAGVHALNQCAHFDLNTSITSEKLKYALNNMLPKDIYIKKVEVVEDDFHARFNVQAKEYIYKINLGEYNPIEKDYVYQYNKQLDIVEMRKALKNLEGTHDYRSFTKTNDEKDDYVRTIFKASITSDVQNANIIIISFLGNGFLRYMVRNMVGYLIEIGAGKHFSIDIIDVLTACDRTCAGVTAPPEGLYLKEVSYHKGNILQS